MVSHAIVYATYIFNVLPVRGIRNEEDIPTTPYESFFNSKPCIARFRVFGCPVIVRKWVTQNNPQGKQTERGTRGIFLGFDSIHKGYLVYCPGSRHIITSEDVTFDESFITAIALSWQQHRDSLALRPVLSTIPLITETIEHTGGPGDFSQVKEGNSITESTETAGTHNQTPETAETQDDQSNASSTTTTSSVANSIVPWDMIHPQQPSAPESDLFIMDTAKPYDILLTLENPTPDTFKWPKQ